MLQSSDTTITPAHPPWGELLDLAEAMRDLADRATTVEGPPALDDLVNLAVERVPAARWASLTVLRATRSAPMRPPTRVRPEPTSCSTSWASARASTPCSTTRLRQ